MCRESFFAKKSDQLDRDALLGMIEILKKHVENIEIRVSAQYRQINKLTNELTLVHTKCDRHERMLRPKPIPVEQKLIVFDFDKNFDNYVDLKSDEKPSNFQLIRRKSRGDPLHLPECLFLETLKIFNFVKLIDTDTCQVRYKSNRTECNVVMTWCELAALWLEEYPYVVWAYYFPELTEDNNTRLDNKTNWCARDVYCGWSQSKCDRLKKRGYLCERQAYIQNRTTITEKYNKMVERCAENFRRIVKTFSKALLVGSRSVNPRRRIAKFRHYCPHEIAILKLSR